MISTLVLSLSLTHFWSQRFLFMKGVAATILRLGHLQNLQSWKHEQEPPNSIKFGRIRIELQHSCWARGAWTAPQPRTVVFWLCLTGRCRLFRAFSIPFSRDVSLGEVSCIAALARSLAASINLSVLSFASKAMVIQLFSIKSYTHNTTVSANPSNFFGLNLTNCLSSLPIRLVLSH